jgi:hypothetical protein
MGREPVDPRTINEATYQPVKHTKGEKTMKWIVSRQRLAEWPKPGARFTLRLVTAIVVAVTLLVILMPAGAKAVPAFFNVFITDPIDNTRQARVTPVGSLRVLATGGEVLAHARPTLSPFSFMKTGILGVTSSGYVRNRDLLGAFGKEIQAAITSLTVTTTGGELAPGASVEFIATHGCGGSSGFELSPPLFVQVGPHETVHLDFPYPLVVPTENTFDDWCFRATVFGDDRHVAVTAVGYLQLGPVCPNPSPCIGTASQ